MAEEAPTPRVRDEVDRVPHSEAVRAGRPDGLGAPTPPGGVGLANGTAALTGPISRGDRRALGLFYEAWFDRCYMMARSITRRDEAFCLDVVQDAMLRVARGVRAMESDADLARWMVRVVHSCALDMLRRDRRRSARERRAATRESQSGGAGEWEVAWLARALATLDEQERAMLALRFGREATLEVVGQASGTTGDGAHGRIRRTLTRLRRLLE